MPKELLAMFLLLALVVSATIAEAAGVKSNVTNPKEINVRSQQIAPQNSTDSFFKDLLRITLSQYNDDLNQSSFILDGFIKKNISSRDAMIASTSLYVLTSYTIDYINQTKPPKKYAIYFNSTTQALINLRVYLWNIAKYYETGKTPYAISAREYFNSSLYYYQKASQYSYEKS
jgi:hypothetical protein